MTTETKLADMTHDEAINALCDCASTVTVLSYQEAIEGYFKLRGMDWNQRTAKTYEQGLEDCLLLVREAQENIFGPTTRQAVLTELDNNIRALAKGDV